MKAETTSAGAVVASRVCGTPQPVRLDRWLLQGSFTTPGTGVKVIGIEPIGQRC
ncbi:hypothetical protein [Nocardia sp. NPDC004260]